MMDKWDKRFLEVSELVSTWSKDPTQVGAVIVKDRHIISTGYNGLPQGMDDSRVSDREYKIPRVVHAELNALANSIGDVRGSTIYVTHPPCNDCAKALASFGVAKVVCYMDERIARVWNMDITKEILAETGVYFEVHKRDENGY